MTNARIAELTGLGPQAFLDDVWDARAVCVGGARDRFEDLLSSADVDGLIAANALEPDALTLLRDGKRVPWDLYRADATIARDRAARDAVDPARLRDLYADGASLLLHGLERKRPVLAALAAALRDELHLRAASVNAILSPPGAAARTLGVHYDVCGVLVLQLEGAKQWRVYEPAFALPLEHHGFAELGAPPSGAPTGEWTLRPGDALFVPRGHLHVAEPTWDHSLHLAIQLVPNTAYDVLRRQLLDALEAAARADATLRRTVAAPAAAPAHAPASVADVRGRAMYRTGDAPVEYRRRDDDEVPCVAVRVDGNELALPLAAEPLLARMRCSRDPFCAESLHLAMPARLQRHVLEALAERGLLEKCSVGAPNP